MSSKPTAENARRKPMPHAAADSAALPVAGALPLPLRIVWLGAALALAGSALLVDTSAEAAFDAPKRTCVIGGAVLAAIALLWCPAQASVRIGAVKTWPSAARCAVICALLLALCALIATFASPHADVAWTSLRRAALFGLCVVAGASRAFDARGGKSLFAVFVGACTINALISLLQTLGMQLPLHVTQIGGRYPTGALLGNEGYVALACALLGAACVALATSEVRARVRIAALGACALCLIVIVLNRQVTAAFAFAAALVVIAAVRWRKQWIAMALVGVIALAAGTALIAPLRALTWACLPVGGVEGYQRLTTYRLGAWLAAADMAAARPLTGYGLGSYALEQQSHRLQAEIDLRERFVQPTGATFVYAHDDYLQLAAEAGVPALLFCLGAIGALWVGLVRLPRAPRDVERALLLAVLSTGAVAALAWFPLQIPFVAAALLLAAGRAWRVIAVSTAP